MKPIKIEHRALLSEQLDLMADSQNYIYPPVFVTPKTKTITVYE